MRPNLLRSLAAALALSCVAPSALAQNQPKVDVYHFDDDDLIGATWGTTPPLITVVGPHPRLTLLRPRASFVPELLKSVEVL